MINYTIIQPNTSHKMSRWLTQSILFILIATYSPPFVSAYAQGRPEATTRFELEEVLAIGEDESSPHEYLFASPQHIRSDTSGRVYVVDRGNRRVRIYSPQGEFLGALGRRGKGPGEFNQISAIALDSEERLIVYDRMLQRFTQFPHFTEIDALPLVDPKQVKTFPNPEEYMISPDFMYGLPEGHLVLFYHPLIDRSPNQPRLHIYNERFEKVDTFGSPNQWHLPRDGFIKQLTRRFDIFSGSHVAPGKSTLLLGPWAYGGTLYQYTRTSRGNWALRRINGQPPGHPTHEVVYQEVSATGSPHLNGVSKPSPPYRSLNSSLRNGRVMQSAARPRSMSRGVGQLSDGRIVHLSMKEDDEGILQLQLELFGQDGTLRKVGPVARFVHDETEPLQVAQAVRVALYWIDHKDCLYFVDYRSGFPVIRIMKLEN